LDKIIPALNRAACTLRAKCIDCDIRKSALFANLDKNELENLLQPVYTQRHEPRTRLYGESMAGHYAYTVRSGLVKLVKAISNGETRIVRLISQADFIGLEILLNEPYRHTAIAITPIEVCRIPLDVLKNLDLHSRGFHNQLMTRWQKSVDEAENMITELSTGKASARLAHLILRYFDDGLAEIWNSPARDDIAQMLDVTTETASRLMAEFKREGLIAENHGTITIRDAVALKQIANS
jgi:CRP/FNR family transcriptional regulator, anaerobic regulatory protein